MAVVGTWGDAVATPGGLLAGGTGCGVGAVVPGGGGLGSGRRTWLPAGGGATIGGAAGAAAAMG